MKIALIGSAPSSVRLGPYSDPSWKIWACSPGCYSIVPRSEKWFELHRWEPPVLGRPDQQKPWFSPEYCAWMARHPCVIMADKVTEIPNSVAIDVQGLTQRYGSYFFTSSLAWMFAMALDEIREHGDKDNEIGLWGVDMAACTSGDARVLTADLRWIRSDEVEVGDKLMAFDEEAESQTGNGVAQRRWRTADVLEASRLTKPCYRLTLEDGRELICSDDHRWLTHSENSCQWRMAKDMVTPHHRADRPSKIVQLTDVWVEDKSWEAGYLAAAFDGEGHLSQKLRDGDNGILRAGFAQRNNVMSDLVLDAMHKRGFDLTQDNSGGQNGDCFKYTVKGGRIENLRFLGSIRPRRLLEKFKPDDLGILHKSGKIAVIKSEFIGDYPVIGLRTSTKTFICEGLASHNTEEYGYQRAGCQFFTQLANQMGIKVIVPPESDLLMPPPLYGVGESDHKYIKSMERKRELELRLSNAQNTLHNATREVAFLQGAIDDVTYQMNTWMQDGDVYGCDFNSLFQDETPRLRAVKDA